MLLLQRNQERRRKQAHSPDQLFASAMISEFKNYWDMTLMDKITSYRSVRSIFNINDVTWMCLRWLNLFICIMVTFLNWVFQQERFNWFLWFLASWTKNGQTIRKDYLVFCRCKNVWDIKCVSINVHRFKEACLVI